MPRDYRRGKPRPVTTDQHKWLPGFRNGNPIMVCMSCKYVWWPDRPAPTVPCEFKVPTKESKR